MSEMTAIAFWLLAALIGAAALVVVIVAATPLPWWSGLLLLPLLDAGVLVWARRRLRTASRRAGEG